MVTHDYIGPDPLVWVERLLNVNEDSSFTAVQRSIIRLSLTGLHDKLQNESFEIQLNLQPSSATLCAEGNHDSISD